MAISAEPARDLEPSSSGRANWPARETPSRFGCRSSTICETPVSAFLKLRTDGPCFLLESAEQGRLGRYSFLGFRPRSVVRWQDGVLSEWPGDATAGTEPAARHDAPDPYAAVSEHLGRYRLAPVNDLPRSRGAPSDSSVTTWLTVEPLGEPNPDPIGLPDMALMVSDVLVVFDHMRHELTLLAYAFLDEGTDVDTAYAGRPTTSRPAGAPPRAGTAGAETPRDAPAGTPVPEFTSNMSRGSSRERAADHRVHPRGRRLPGSPLAALVSAPSPVEPFSIYRGLRTVHPSPYMYFLDFGDFQIAGASPEPLVKVTGDRVETRPIAVTYSAGPEEEDRRQADELLRAPKSAPST